MSYGKVHRLAICIYITPMDHSNPMNPALWHAFSCLTFGGGRYAILIQTTCLIITCNKKMNKTPAPFCKSHCVCCPIFSICGIHSWQKENASKLGADTVAWPLGDLLDHTLPCFIRSHISPYGGDAYVDVNEGLGCSRSDDASLHCTTLIHQLLHFFTVFLLGLVQSLFWRRHQKRFGSNLLK